MHQPLLEGERPQKAETNRKPFIVGSVAFAAIGTLAYFQLKGTSEDPLNVIAARRDKIYVHDEPDGYDTYSGTCSAAQNTLWQASVAAVMPVLNASMNSEDSALFEKWFGTSTAESDADVRSRINECVAMMENYPDGWRPLCCNEVAGACDGCGGSTIAYVMSWVMDNWETGTLYEETWVRMCPTMLASTNEIAIGLVIFHELMHMISAAGDIQGAYSKLGAHTLATTNPEQARLSADNYTMYMAQNGLSYEDYTQLTYDWWNTNAESTTCSDTYGSYPYCWDQAKSCCDFAANPQLQTGCCASCTRMAVSAQCAGDSSASAPVSPVTPPNDNVGTNLGADPIGPNDCRDKYSNCNDAQITGTGCCGVQQWNDGTLWAAECCATCAARDAAGLCEPVGGGGDPNTFNCGSNADWWNNCADMVGNISCDGRTWSDGTVYWDECCVSCLAKA